MYIRMYVYKYIHRHIYIYISTYRAGAEAHNVADALLRHACIRQHTSAYVSIRQHTSAYVSIRQHTSDAHNVADAFLSLHGMPDRDQHIYQLHTHTHIPLRGGSVMTISGGGRCEY
jgi:hypothetical protein